MYGGKTTGKQFLFFSRNGFKPEVEAVAKTDASIRLIAPDMLVYPPAAALKEDMDESPAAEPPTPGRSKISSPKVSSKCEIGFRQLSNPNR